MADLITDAQEFAYQILAPDLADLLDLPLVRISYNTVWEFWDISITVHTYNDSRKDWTSLYNVRHLPLVWDYFCENFPDWGIRYQDSGRFWVEKQKGSKHNLSKNQALSEYYNFPISSPWKNSRVMREEIIGKMSTTTEIQGTGCCSTSMNNCIMTWTTQTPHRLVKSVLATLKERVNQAGYYAEHVVSYQKKGRTTIFQFDFQANTI